MSRIAAIIAATLAMTFGCQGQRQSSSQVSTTSSGDVRGSTTAKWKTIEEFNFGWKPGQHPLHVKLELPEPYDSPGDFIRIQIKVDGLPTFVLDNQDGWIEYDSQEQKSEVYSRLKRQNLVASRYVLILPSSTNGNDPPLIFLRSWGYASDAERFHVIGFEPSGQPLTLLNEQFDLTELGDRNRDGNLEIVGRPCMAEEWGPDLLTYAPFNVYTVTQPVLSPIKLSVELSKAYNLEHYYGWAGPDCSSDLAVVLHPPNGAKPFITEAKKAEALMREKASNKK